MFNRQKALTPAFDEQQVCALAKTISYTHTQKLSVDFRKLSERKVMGPENGCPSAMEEYKLLKAQVLKKARDGGWNTFMVTSVGEGEGKTLTAINLALAISRELEETCLLVEADMRKPNMLNYFGSRAKPGLSDYLLRDVPLAEVLINPGIDRFVFLPGGKSIPNSGEILGSTKMQDLVSDMKRCYSDRYVIYDLPPLFECADPLIFSEYVDGILLVVEAYRTTTDQVRSAMELLEGKNIIGLVLNKIKVDKNRYYHRYYR
jgi:protein-tyrosine kinase